MNVLLLQKVHKISRIYGNASAYTESVCTFCESGGTQRSYHNEYTYQNQSTSRTCQFLQFKSTKSSDLRERTEKDIVCDQSFGELVANDGRQDGIIFLDQSTVKQLSGHDYKHLRFCTILLQMKSIPMA